MIVWLTAACINAVAITYAVPEHDLWALMAQEAGRVGEVVHNTNHTYDIGPFQVNSRWIGTFTRLWAQPSDATTLEKLQNNGCWNAAAAAVIYRAALDEAHGDRRRALAFYHSHSPALGAQYLKSLEMKFQRLFGTPGFEKPLE